MVITHKRKICKYFVNTGKCPKENSCNFVHINNPESKQEYLLTKAYFRSRLETAETNSELNPWRRNHESSTPDEVLESRHARARIFAKWVATNFFKKTDQMQLQTKTVIYDVAGGKGEVAFELCVRQRKRIGHNFHCIIVDPRKPNKYESGALPKWQKTMIKVKFWRNFRCSLGRCDPFL